MRFVFLLGALFLLSGCSLVDQRVALNYQPQIKTLKPAKHAVLALGAIDDFRGYGSDMLSFKQDPYGRITSKRYLSVEPLKEVVKDSLVKSLQASGYNVDSKGAHLQLTGEVLNYLFDPDNSSLKGNVKTKLELGFALINTKTKAQVWSKSFAVQTVYHDGPFNFKSDKAILQLEFQQAMNKIMTQLVTSDGFRQALKRYG